MTFSGDGIRFYRSVTEARDGTIEPGCAILMPDLHEPVWRKMEISREPGEGESTY